MNESIRTAHSNGQSPTSHSIEALEEIVRNCQRNEERLHELERHTRHERKKAERLLKETCRTINDRDSRNTSVLDNTTTNDYSHIDNKKSKQRLPPAKEFFVSIDDDDDNNENLTHHRRQTNNNNKNVSQDKHLLERVEKLLAGDGTTTSSEVMSSQERQKKVIEKPTSPVEDDLDEKSLDIDQKHFLPESRHIPSACSIEYDLSTVDRLLSEQTPNNNHRIKSDTQTNQEHQPKKTVSYDDEEQYIGGDNRDQQFYQRLNNYVQTGRFVSSDQEKQTTTTDDETYQHHSRPNIRLNNRDDELADLARRCEDLLGRLHAQRNRAMMLENSTHKYDSYRRQTPPRSSSSHESTHQHHHHRHHQHHRSLSPTPPPAPPPMSLQQALELLRPEFISRSRQRARRVRLLREEREHNAEIDRERREMLLFSCTTCCSNPTNRTVSASSSSSRRNMSYIIPYDHSDRSRIPLTYRQIKEETKKKYEQLPEVHDRRRQKQMSEIRRRNLFRAKVFRARLKQHVVRHGRTNIDESLTMVDT